MRTRSPSVDLDDPDYVAEVDITRDSQTDTDEHSGDASPQSVNSLKRLANTSRKGTAMSLDRTTIDDSDAESEIDCTEDSMIKKHDRKRSRFLERRLNAPIPADQRAHSASRGSVTKASDEGGCGPGAFITKKTDRQAARQMAGPVKTRPSLIQHAPPVISAIQDVAHSGRSSVIATLPLVNPSAQRKSERRREQLSPADNTTLLDLMPIPASSTVVGASAARSGSDIPAIDTSIHSPTVDRKVELPRKQPLPSATIPFEIMCKNTSSAPNRPTLMPHEPSNPNSQWPGDSPPAKRKPGRPRKHRLADHEVAATIERPAKRILSRSLERTSLQTTMTSDAMRDPVSSTPAPSSAVLVEDGEVARTALHPSSPLFVAPKQERSVTNMSEGTSSKIKSLKGSKRVPTSYLSQLGSSAASGAPSSEKAGEVSSTVMHSHNSAKDPRKQRQSLPVTYAKATPQGRSVRKLKQRQSLPFTSAKATNNLEVGNTPQRRNSKSLPDTARSGITMVPGVSNHVAPGPDDKRDSVALSGSSKRFVFTPAHAREAEGSEDELAM